MKKYSIGEVSSRLGLSRDTLRFYEKKGIIQPEKQENGYRSYTYEDTRRLLDIMFFRRLNFSLEDISRILYQSSFESYYSMIQEKITEEQKLLEQHRQSLIHLKYLAQLYKNVRKFLNSYDIRPLRRYYKMDSSGLLDQLEIFDLCYIYQEYAINGSLVRQTDEYFLMAADTASIMKLEQRLEGHLFIQHEHCVYTVIPSNSRIPSEDSVLAAADWAREQGYKILGNAYTGFLLSCSTDSLKSGPKEEQPPENEESEPVYYIELYLPVENPEKE